MGSAPRFTVGLAAFALLLAGGAGIAAAGQADGGLDRQPRAWDSKTDMRSAAATRGRDRRPSRAAAEKQAPAASAPSNGSSGSRSSGPGASSGAASPTGQANASPVAVATAPPLSGLSHDAPESAPSVGVIGGGGSSSGSPSATPEPSTLLLMGAGLAGLYRLRRRQ